MKGKTGETGWDWLVGEDGRVLFKPGRSAQTVIISRKDLKAINWARTTSYLAFVGSCLLVFVMNGRWWHAGQSVAIGLGIIAILAGLNLVILGRVFWLKGRIVSRAPPAEVEIEKGSVARLSAVLLRRFSSPLLVIFVPLALFLDVWLFMDILRLISLGPDPSELHGRRVSGPLNGLIALVPLSYLTYRVIVELWRRLRDGHKADF